LLLVAENVEITEFLWTSPISSLVHTFFAGALVELAPFALAVADGLEGAGAAAGAAASPAGAV